ncbi:ATP-dependent nuclease [Lysinibacillus agricola]|uniref:ATP-dependent nuclease n=1 Tax=Lysinibacillus agricola TaxID=2590012 RepID=UPI003C22BD03
MIRIEKIGINNYRKFYGDKSTTISLDDDITAIVGANNSGKTSLVELLSNIFKEKNYLNIEDMNSKARFQNELKIEQIINDKKISKDDRLYKLKEIHKELKKITIELSIKYDDKDNIELFSSYLLDLDITKKNFYFLIEYEYIPAKEEEILDILEKKINFKEIYSMLQPKIYYCNEDFENKIRIADKSNFYNLFNYHCVYAIRKLADTSDEKQNFLSKHLLKTVQNNTNWKENVKELILGINSLLTEKDLSSKVDKITLEHIKKTLHSFSKTNGGNTGNLGVDFKLENKDIEKVLLDFIHIYFEQDEGIKIKEQKQGLGYSNLIYLLLEAQIFSEKIDTKKANLLIFEEPEAHLHPQMENIFIRYINVIAKGESNNEVKVTEVTEAIKARLTSEIEAGRLNVAATAEETTVTKAQTTDTNMEIKEKNIPFQMLITSHSSEMTKSIGLDNIRVFRSNGHTISNVYDLRNFINKDDTDKEFYEKFFQFNMVDMVFADKLILFEGDAERLLFKYLISQMDKYEDLSSQYISYIQVGGAYAHKYLDLINFLEIKTLIFTDIDYEYKKEDIELNTSTVISEILKRETSNDTIKQFVKETKIDDIYKKSKQTNGEYLENKKVCLKFQTKKDGYARTLEDAMLKKLLQIDNVFTKIPKKDFGDIITNYKLLMSNTNKKETSIRDRIDKLQNKTDFMYALIYSDKIKEAIPQYIEEGLDWLKG